jgi:MscS family membrane protein
MKVSHLISACILACSIFVSPLLHAQAQDKNQNAIAAPVQSAVDRGPEDALGRGNPRGSIIGFLNAASELDFEKAAEYLDLRNLPDDALEVGGPELARQLNQVISRSIWLDDYTVSNSAAGLKGDGLPEFRDEIIRIPTQNGEVPIWMQKVPRGDGEFIWKISNRSVALIPELYDEYSYPEAIERLRQWFPEDASFLGFEAFKWVIILAAAILAWPILYVVGWLLSHIFSSPKKEIYPTVRKLFSGPFIMVGILLIMGHVANNLGLGAYAQQVADARTLNTIAIIWILWSIIELYKKHKQNRLLDEGRAGASKLMQPISTLLKMLVLIFGLLFWLNNIGVNITTVLAGLGVGGLAVALALQKPIEDMMGALTIFSQTPMRVGDLVRYGDVLGSVEDIGLRTTRIRTLTNTVVSIPNARIAHVEVENLTYRTKIRFWPTLRLRYDTSPERLKGVVEQITRLLLDDERVYDEPLRVNLTDFADDAILIKIHSFLKTTDFAEFLNISEELNYAIMRILDEEGVRFALPGRSIHLEGDPSAPHV